MSDDSYVPFEVREGGRPAPAQMKRDEVSRELVSLIWYAVHETFSDVDQSGRYLPDDRRAILRKKHVLRDHSPIDDFEEMEDSQILELLRGEIYGSVPVDLYGLVEWLVRNCEDIEFRSLIEGALVQSRAPFRLVDGNLLSPLTNVEQATALERALKDIEDSGVGGARSHLRAATSHATSGRWADSIRESIHAVASVAIAIAPGTNDLGPALTKLEQAGHVHGGLKRAFAAVYGFTSDEDGVRHALVFSEEANVDEADALFMLGACASFCSYLVAKARGASLLAT